MLHLGLHLRSVPSRLALVALLPLSNLACSDEEPPPQQAVVWLSLGTAIGGTCPALSNFEFPQSARTFITTDGRGEPGEVDRIVDGGQDLVSCEVSLGEMPDTFDVDFEFSSGAIGNMIASGTVSYNEMSANNGGTFRVNLQANSGGLQLAQSDCSVTVKEAIPGAIWIDSLSCPNMVQARSPGQSCTGTGGLILENCAR